VEEAQKLDKVDKEAQKLVDKATGLVGSTVVDEEAQKLDKNTGVDKEAQKLVDKATGLIGSTDIDEKAQKLDKSTRSVENPDTSSSTGAAAESESNRTA
jgi:hypothetical protein